MFGKMAMGLEYLFRTRPLTMPPSQLGAFAKSNPAQPSANIEWHVQPLSLDKFGCAAACLSRDHAVGVRPAPHQPRPRAHQELRPARDPAIMLNYLSTMEDKIVAVEAIRFTRRIMQAKALAKYQPEEFKPGPDFKTDLALMSAAGDLAPPSSTRSAPAKWASDELAVVDDRLRVRGIAGLRVIDASVMPRITVRQHQRADHHDRREGRRSS